MNGVANVERRGNSIQRIFGTGWLAVGEWFFREGEFNEFNAGCVCYFKEMILLLIRRLLNLLPDQPYGRRPVKRQVPVNGIGRKVLQRNAQLGLITGWP